jgi:hypothetical protein
LFAKKPSSEGEKTKTSPASPKVPMAKGLRSKSEKKLRAIKRQTFGAHQVM